MGGNEPGITAILAALLLGLAGYFGWQQIRTLRGLSPEALGAGDRRFLKSQAYRRLVCTFLMVVFAGLLIGWLFLEAEYQEVRDELKAAQLEEPPPPMTDSQKDFARLITVYWVGALMVLFVLLVLGAMDFWATARYGLSQHRRLKADHRAMLEKQASRRHEGNGFRKKL